MSGINIHGVLAIYRSEMARTRRTILQSIATPVITTALYFIVFGGAIGSRMQHVGGVGYGAFIVPGLIMLSLLTQSISNASVGIYFPNSPGPCSRSSRPPQRHRGGDRLCRRGGDQIGDHRPDHSGDLHLLHRCAHPASGVDGGVPAAHLHRFLALRLHHRHLGEKLRAALDHPLADRHAADLSGRGVLFHRHAAPAWRTVSLFNPVVYLVSGFRWSFYGLGDVSVGVSLGFTACFMAVCLAVLWWIFRTGWRLKP
jgi:ABC-2 type transport system permease protein